MIMKQLLILIVILAICECRKPSSVEKPYLKGIKAYKDERWSECIAQFEESLHLYKLYKSTIVNCRMKCNSQNFEPEIKEDIGDLKAYEIFFNRKQCLLKCKEKEFEDLNLEGDIEEAVLYGMQARKPYEYLHICYYQMNMAPKAASAVFTYLVANPDDEQMKSNLQYYTQQREVDANEVTDFLSDDYQALYRLGLDAYQQNNWLDAVANMEEVLTDYFTSENSCRVECERQPEQEWSPEISITISNNIAALLHCQQQCQDKLKVLDYNTGVEFIADILNYIQICYYRLNRVDDAAKATATYLMMLPDDEDMLINKNIYSSIADPKSFSERSDVAYYFKRDKYEKKLIQLFHSGNNNDLVDNTV